MVNEKTKILFCFDSEDYTAPRSADMLVRLADTLGSHGVVGHFMVVGLLAEYIEKAKRTDVTEALKDHDIGFHTYGHSLHPTLSEYTDIESYEEAQVLLESEERAAETVKRVFDRERLCAAVPPGSAISYAAMYRYAEIGIPCYADSPLKEAESPVWMCNELHVPYNYALEDFLFYPEFYIDRFLDFLHEKKQVTLYNHPNMICFSEFWDKVNYDKKNLSVFGKWKTCPSRTDEEIERFFRHLDQLIRALKEDPRFEITSIGDILDEAQKERVIRRSDAANILAELKENRLMAFSRSELVMAAAAFLKNPELTEWKTEPVYGFLEEPVGCKESVELTAEMVRECADAFVTGEFLPLAIRAGDTMIGPMDFLLAAWEVLSGNGIARVQPCRQTEVPAEFEHLHKLSLKGSWLHSDTFEDAYLSHRLRLQTWTLRI